MNRKVVFQEGEQFIGEYSLTDEQTTVAEMLARCVTHKQIIKETGIPQTRITAWNKNPVFRAAVRDIQWSVIESQRESFALLIADSMMIESQALHGEIRADDPRARLAHDILAKTAYRIATNADVTSQQLAVATHPPTHVLPSRSTPTTDLIG